MLAAFVSIVAQQRHGLGGEARAIDDDRRISLHRRLEAALLEQRDRLGGLVHLVDGVVHRLDQVLDVAPVERRDEGPAHREQHLVRHLVGRVFVPHDLLAPVRDRSPPSRSFWRASAPASSVRECCSNRSKNLSSRGSIALNHSSMSISLGH